MSRKAWITEAVDHYEGRLIRYAVRITGNLEQARDVVQEVFLNICHHAATGKPEDLPQRLFTICRCRAIDSVRKNKRNKTVISSSDDGPASDMPSPSKEIEQKEEAHTMLAEIAQLPQDQQEVLRLKFQEGMSYKEISQIIGKSVSNVGFLIHSAIKVLRGRLTPCEESPVRRQS